MGEKMSAWEARGWFCAVLCVLSAIGDYMANGMKPHDGSAFTILMFVGMVACWIIASGVLTRTPAAGPRERRD